MASPWLLVISPLGSARSRPWKTAPRTFRCRPVGTTLFCCGTTGVLSLVEMIATGSARSPPAEGGSVFGARHRSTSKIQATPRCIPFWIASCSSPSGARRGEGCAPCATAWPGRCSATSRSAAPSASATCAGASTPSSPPPTPPANPAARTSSPSALAAGAGATGACASSWAMAGCWTKWTKGRWWLRSWMLLTQQALRTLAMDKRCALKGRSSQGQGAALESQVS
mmetsp:Transcript_43674/g.138528  ORF Transcript_43674/g.138528 Transcript_43674/m.138528 type:complete len:226 (+) Transcript_43674:672-1349(+)